MKKIPSLFERDWEGDRSRVLDQVNPECQWVIDGEGVATRKWDGTAAMIDEQGRIYKRFDWKSGPKVKASGEPPAGWIPCQPERDPVTGHHPGWVPCDPDSNSDAPFFEALTHLAGFGPTAAGTYELCGPKVNRNAENLDTHRLIPHGKAELHAPRFFSALRIYLCYANIEGIVWHHPDGRMAKIKTRDFGLERGG